MGAPVKPPTTLSEWDHHAYRGIEPARDGNFVSADTCLVAAGPPLLSMTGGVSGNLSSDLTDLELSDATAYPIGLIQGVNVGQNRQHMRIYEVGSAYDYLITGRAVGQLSLSKMYFSASSLLRVLYAYYGTNAQATVNPLFSSPIAAANALNDVYISPGTERIFINMFSDLFRNPIGILIVMLTTQNQTLGAFYYERCVVHGHNMAFDAQGIVVQENASLSFGRVVPVHISAVNLLAAAKNFADFFDLTGGA